MESFLFYALAAMVAVAALAMVLSRNLVHSALWMAASFLGMAFVYLLLQAVYVAVVQILVYVGAISILFVFGIMLTKRERIEDSNGFNRYGPVAALVGLSLFALLARSVAVSAIAGAASTAVSATTVSATSVAGDAVSISNLLLGELALPLEATGLLLLAALVGAIVLGQGRSASK
jgi:NADH:ubiquinone oxidoreductase subunit 6 (subunit J)